MTRPSSPHGLIRILTFIILALLVVPVAATDDSPVAYHEKGLSSQIPLTRQEQAWLDRKLTVRVRLSTVPPYHMPSPEPQGISVDYLKRIGTRFGIDFSFVTPSGTWQDAVNDLTGARNHSDLLITMMRTPEREQQFALTHDYLSSPLVIINRTGTDFISQMKDLNSRKVAVEKGFVVEERLKRDYPQIRIVLCDTTLKALQSVATGASDAYIGNLAIVSYLINSNGLKNLRVAAPSPFGNQNLAMAVRKDWPELASIINKSFEAMSESEENEIRNRWLSIRYEYGINKDQLWKWLAGIGGLFVVAVTGAVIWNRRLAREMNRWITAEEQLREANDYLDNLFNYANAPIIVWDPGFRITRFNKAFEALTGRSAAEVIGKKIDLLFPAGQVDRAMTHIENAVRGDRWETIEIPILHVDGRVSTVLWNSATIFTPDGTTPVATIAQGHNITIRKQAEEALRTREEQFRGMFEHHDSVMLLIDPATGQIVDANRAAVRYYGYDHVTLKSLNICAINALSPEEIRSERLQALREERNCFIFPHRLASGEIRTVEVNSSPIPYQGQTILFSIIHDITQRIRAEEQVRKTLADLSRSNEELEQFAYIASHDLQEPLRMVASYTQLLERRYGSQLDQDAREFIGYAVDGANRMQRLIQDLLAYSRVTTRGKPLEPLDSHDIFGEALANLQATIQESGALMTTGDLPAVMGDRSQLVQVFQNLIANAVKFHRPEEPPHIHVSAQRTGAFWTFRVADNGIGIDPKYFDQVFQIFQRLHTRKEYPGTGIGLAICKRTIERHGGRIWVESEPDNGTTFFFTLQALPDS